MKGCISLPTVSSLSPPNNFLVTSDQHELVPHVFYIYSSLDQTVQKHRLIRVFISICMIKHRSVNELDEQRVNQAKKQMQRKENIARSADWLQSLKQFFIHVSYHILVANLTLMALFENRTIIFRLATSI